VVGSFRQVRRVASGADGSLSRTMLPIISALWMMSYHMSFDMRTVGDIRQIFHHSEEWLEWLSFVIDYLPTLNRRDPINDSHSSHYGK
jgi:hypothetical protein